VNASGARSSPAAAVMARHGWNGGSGWRGGKGEQGSLKYKRARVMTADDGEVSPCYGGSTGVRTAGAADGPGVFPHRF
jgi:hypothetical protein